MAGAEPPPGDTSPDTSSPPLPVEASAPAAAAPERRNGFWMGLGGFLAPIAVLSAASMVNSGTAMLWFLAVPFLLVALIGAIIFHRQRRADIGNGALTAIALGLVVLFGTCVYNLSHVSF